MKELNRLTSLDNMGSKAVEYVYHGVPFPEFELKNGSAARCVDGRPAENSERGPQLLGGSIHPILIWTIASNRDFNKENVTEGLSNLKEAGYTLGMHRGSHKNAIQAKSDCGLADLTPSILDAAIKNKDTISPRMLMIYNTAKDIPPFDGLTEQQFMEHVIEASFGILENYDTSRITYHADKLITSGEHDPNLKVSVEDVVGDHQEEVAIVNLKAGITLDTNALNSLQKQALNIDLLEAIKQTKALGVESKFAIGSSLILYLATADILAQKKGQEPPPIAVHR